MAAQMAADTMDVEDWDQDFEGGLNAFAGNVSIGTAQTSISSRLSVRSLHSRVTNKACSRRGAIALLGS